MDTSFYPEVEPSWLLPFRVVFDGMLNDPLWLERNECPYSAELADGLRAIWAKFRVKSDVPASAPRGTRVNLAEADNKWDQLATEMTDLFDELRNFASGIEEADVKEKMAYYRTATALLEKITGLAERAHNVKAVSTFHTTVLRVFDEVLTPEQRTRAMEILAR